MLNSPGKAGVLPRLVLASSSPRRAEILSMVGWPFEICPPNVDETRYEPEGVTDYVMRLALSKAKAVAHLFQSSLVLGADTVVVVDGSVMGKPVDLLDASRMLRVLRGRWHQVITGVAVLDNQNGRMSASYEETAVKFATMSDAEIEWYLTTGESGDKAGGYAAQGRGSLFIEAYDGDYWNVVGLPVQRVYQHISRVLAHPLHS